MILSSEAEYFSTTNSESESSSDCIYEDEKKRESKITRNILKYPVMFIIGIIIILKVILYLILKIIFRNVSSFKVIKNTKISSNSSKLIRKMTKKLRLNRLENSPNLTHILSSSVSNIKNNYNSLYINEIITSIDYIYAQNIPDKYNYFHKLSKIYGRTSLCLSGGAAFGYYHLGVVKCLLERDLLPTVINGTSAGSLIAAIVCTHTNEQLKRILTPSIHEIFTACDKSWWEMLTSLLRTGSIFCAKEWHSKMEFIAPADLTFQEAYERTGRVLNITVVNESSTSKLLNYKTTPNVLIRSAVLASSAVPLILTPIQLQMKINNKIFPFIEEGELWRDGSLRIDIPHAQLHQMFHVNFSIVSQVNPHIIIFFGNNKILEYLLLDIRKYLKLINTDISSIFLQKFDGDVTILPYAYSVRDYLDIITDPSYERMRGYLERGGKSVAPYLDIIERRMSLERRLREIF